jgi:hypothetical protein
MFVLVSAHVTELPGYLTACQFLPDEINRGVVVLEYRKYAEILL